MLTIRSRPIAITYCNTQMNITHNKKNNDFPFVCTEYSIWNIFFEISYKVEILTDK